MIETTNHLEHMRGKMMKKWLKIVKDAQLGLKYGKNLAEELILLERTG